MMRQKEAIQGAFHTRAQNSRGGKDKKKTKNVGTKKKKTPTSNKAKPFLLIHIAKRQTIFKENVGGGQMSSAKIVAIWDM